MDEAERVSEETEKHPEGPPELPPGVRLEAGVEIGRAGDRPLRADVIGPETPPEIPAPAIVFVHGSAWKLGRPSQFHYQAGRLAQRYGGLGISVDYRLTPTGAAFPAPLNDVKCALRWTRAQAPARRLDPERVGVCGGSAGAHLAALALVTPDQPEYEGEGGWRDFSSRADLAVLFNGEFDLWDLVRRRGLINAMTAFLGGTAEEAPRLYHEASPIERAKEKTGPVLLLHGTEDRCVSHAQSLAFAAKLESLGTVVETEIYPGKPHAWFNSEPDRARTWDRVERFLDRHF